MRAENSAVPKKMLRRLRRLALLAHHSLAKSMKAPRRVHVLEYSGFAAAKVVTLDDSTYAAYAAMMNDGSSLPVAHGLGKIEVSEAVPCLVAEAPYVHSV